jgi:hypothetical protein
MKLSKSVLGTIGATALTVSAAFATVPAQTSSCSYQFNTNLRLGAVSTDVQNLQKLLNMDAATRVAATGAGSMGSETLRFGPATFAAVKKFQAANGVSPQSGYVGPLTRAVLNTVCSSTAPTNPTNTGNSGVSSNSIPVSVLVQGQAAAKLGEFVVTGNGSVTNITLQRTGLSNNSTLANVYLYDGNTRLTDAASVRTDGSISFNSGSGLFTVNGSKTLTVRADIASSNTSGQTVGVALTGVTMMGGSQTPVNGVAGPLFSISSAQTVTANLTTTAPSPAAATINAGSMNQTIWRNNVSIGTNPAKLNGVTFKMIGSAPANTLSNVQLYVDGVSKGSATINAMNQFVFDMSGMPAALTTGSHLLELRADVVGGAYRNFYMSLEQAADLRIEDSTLPGIQVTPTYLAGTLTNINGGTVTINNGTLTITQDPAFNNTTNLVGGASQIPLASFKVTAYGEDVKITTLTFTAAGTGFSPASTTLANVGLYINGGQVGSNQTVNLTAGNTFTFSNLGSNLYVPAGQSVIVQVKGDTSNTSGTAYTAGTLTINMNAGSSNAQGVSSSQTTSTSAVGGQTLTIGNNVTFGVTSGFGASTKAPNSQMVKIGSYSISAGSAEGLNINQITVALTGTMLGVNQISNLRVMDGSNTVGTPIGNPTASNSFSANVSVPAGTTKVLDVYADFGSGASTYTAITAATVTYLGSVSNISATTASAGGVIAITAGAAQIIAGGVTLNSGLSPVSQNVIGGQTNFAIGTFNVKVNNAIGGAVLKDLTFTVPANSISSITVNGKTGSVVGTTATVFNVGLSVPSDSSGVNVPVTVSLVCVGTSNGCPANSPVTATVQLTTLTYNDGTQVQTISPTPITNSMSIYGSKPSFAVNTTQQTGLNIGGAENKIGEVTISADAAGSIKVNNIAFNIGSSGLTAALALSGVRIADGNATIAGSSVSSGCTTTGACVMTFGASPNGYTIAAGSSKTFSLYGTVTNSASASVVVSVSSSVTAATTTWDDTLGGATNATAANVYNFPTGSYSIRQ